VTATEALQQFKELNPEDNSCYIMEGDLAYQFSDFEQAIDWYDKAIRNAWNEPGLYLKRGMARAAAGDGGGGVEDFHECIRLGEGDEALVAEATRQLDQLQASG
jgi:tetratricopeptide (TPR) repeat protein